MRKVTFTAEELLTKTVIIGNIAPVVVPVNVALTCCLLDEFNDDGIVPLKSDPKWEDTNDPPDVFSFSCTLIVVTLVRVPPTKATNDACVHVCPYDAAI